MFVILALSLIYHININAAEYSNAGTQVEVRQNWTNIPTRGDSRRPTDLYYVTRATTYWLPTLPMVTNTIPLMNSNCFCSYYQITNLFSCSPFLQNSSSNLLSSSNLPMINVTLTDCIFFDNHFSLPIIKGKNIDYLRLQDVNLQDYLVFDATSFSSYSINHVYIFYRNTQRITMLLISNETFSSSTINLSLRTLYMDTCYLITLNEPLNRLYSLESITLLNIQQFSWYDFQQQMIYLSKLRYIYIGEDLASRNNNIANVVSCDDISAQWMLTYRLVQTCSCKFMSLLTTLYRFGNAYRCPNSDSTIEFLDSVCQFNGKEYNIQNQTNSFCKKCLSYQCPNGTLCTEALNSIPNCASLTRYDYETIRKRIPLTPYTKQFLFQESQQFLNVNPNKTLQPIGFNSVVSFLIDSNQNHTENSPSDAQMFHQTFAEMLERPWSPDIYSSAAASPPAMWQQLLTSLDESVKNINDSEPKFEFQSPPISTMSLRFPTNQQPHETFGWKITNDNKITANITNSKFIDKNVTSRVFLNFYNDQSYKPNCDTS